MKYVNAYESYTWFENNSEKENQRKLRYFDSLGSRKLRLT